jgi:uncharacterized membrane protein HdeD (DUF308 family)
MESIFARRWWVLAVRGAAGIAFGLIALTHPVSGLVALVILFGAYALVDGIFNLTMTVPQAKRHGERWGALLAEGILSVVAGLVALIWPGISAVALLLVIAFWAVATGIMAILSAVRLRRMIKGEWLLGLAGALSIALGVLLFMYPAPGALAMVIWIGAYALVSGIMLVALSFRVRSWAHRAVQPAHPAPVPA